MIPDCAASLGDTVFAMTGSTLPPGCNVCTERGSIVTLDCTVTAGAPPITYNWTRDTPDNTVSRNPLLVVTEPGDYTCTAGNVDERFMSRSSVLFCEFSFSLILVLTAIVNCNTPTERPARGGLTR